MTVQESVRTTPPAGSQPEMLPPPEATGAGLSAALPPPPSAQLESLLRDPRFVALNEAMRNTVEVAYFRPGFANAAAFASRCVLDGLLEQHSDFLRAHPEACALLSAGATAHEERILRAASVFDDVVTLARATPPEVSRLAQALTSTDPQLLRRIAVHQGVNLGELLGVAFGPANADAASSYLASNTEGERLQRGACLLFATAPEPPAVLRSALRALIQSSSIEASREFESQLMNGTLGAASPSLGNQFGAWLEAYNRGNTARADVLRLYEALVTDGVSGRTVVDSLLTLPPAHVQAMNAELRGYCDRTLGEALPAATSRVDRELYNLALAPERNSLRIEALLLIRALNPGGTPGATGFVMDCAELNALVRGRSQESIQTLLASARREFAAFGLGDLDQRLRTGTRTIERWVAQTLLDQGGVDPERLSILLAQATVFTGAERELRGMVSSLEGHARALRTTADNHGASTADVQADLRAAGAASWSGSSILLGELVGPRAGPQDPSAASPESVLISGLTRTTDSRVDDALTALDYSIGLLRTAGAIYGHVRRPERGGTRIGTLQLTEARVQFDNAFFAALGSREGTVDPVPAQTMLERAMKSIREGSCAAQRIFQGAHAAYARGVGRDGDALSGSIASLDAADRNLRNARTLAVALGSIAATGGAASGAAAPRVVTALRSVFAGTAAGTGIGAAGNAAEARSHIHHGTLSADEAFRNARYQTGEDLRLAFNASVGTVAGNGVARLFRPEALSWFATIRNGALVGGTSASVQTVADGVERYFIASNEFEAAYGSLTGEEREQARATFLRDRGADFDSIGLESARAFGEGMFMGALGGTAGRMRTQAQSAFGRAVAVGRGIAGTGIVAASILNMDPQTGAERFAWPTLFGSLEHFPGQTLDALVGPNDSNRTTRLVTSWLTGGMAATPRPGGAVVLPPAPRVAPTLPRPVLRP